VKINIYERVCVKIVRNSRGSKPVAEVGPPLTVSDVVFLIPFMCQYF